MVTTDRNKKYQVPNCNWFNYFLLQVTIANTITNYNRLTTLQPRDPNPISKKLTHIMHRKSIVSQVKCSILKLLNTNCRADISVVTNKRFTLTK